MRKHKFKAMQMYNSTGKPITADWCVYIDAPIEMATAKDFCQQTADHPNHEQEPTREH